MVYDEELGCRVHLGFRNQADRIFKDIQPLLAPTDDKRPTVEVSGHSLGGALTYLIAAKLRKRGYKVVRATSVGAPRFCATAAGASILESLLPRDNLRIENDMDFVPYLPPFSHHVGNKLYLIDESGSVAYIRSAKPIPWVDNAFVNFRAFELLSARGKPHRMPYHVSYIKRAFGNKSQDQ
jgi:predicted lipase